MERVRWLGGEPAVRALLEPILRDPTRATATLLRQRSSRRRHLRVTLPSGATHFVKHWKPAPSRRHALATRLGLATAQREWNALQRLYGAGVAVPEPIALGWLPSGEAVLVTRWEDGTLLADGLPGESKPRRRLLAELGARLAALHAAGIVHRDLHAGNVLVSPHGPVLLDLQAARRSRSARARRRDLAQLDHSLMAALSGADRLRLWAAALGLARPFSGPARRTLRRVGRASRARGRIHAARRTRGAARPGPRFAPLGVGTATGLRLRAVPQAALEEALTAHRRARGDAVLKRDGRSVVTAVMAGGRAVVVKEQRPAGPLGRIADALRGSGGRRAWLGGHGLLARGIGAALPLAFLEERRLGLPVASHVVLEDLRPLRPADALAGEPDDPAPLAQALARLTVDLHRACVVHGDLKASHVFLGWRNGRLVARLCDLEGVRFRRRLGRRTRIQALAELNASLPDAMPAAARRCAFERYAAALPFRGGRAWALRRIVRRSLARGHRWTGADCAVATREARSARK